MKYFKNAYSRDIGSCIEDIQWGIEPYPIMFDENKHDALFFEVSEEELLATMKSFQKDKCLGPDDWTIDFFIHLFDLFKSDILNMVKELRLNGLISHHFSSTYIALIPKKERSASFSDYRPISLCNILYKIISKIIATHMRDILSLHISHEQHGFLKDRNILDAMALTQECLHSIHSRKLDVALLKIDLKNVYDIVDWGFIHCLLARIGLDNRCSRWIMACVVEVNYVVLINGIPTPFFKAARGLRQGYSLSPLLFILIMDSLSLHIKREIIQNKYSPLPICRGINISHNLFVDDILLTTVLCRATWIRLREIMGRFQKATGMCVNEGKSSFHVEDVNGEMIIFLSQLFNIKALPLRNGLNYLGFNLKAVGYCVADWSWILDRFYKRIMTWEYKCLSMGGRMILSQAVLVQIMVYWAHLFYILTAIINSLNMMTANFTSSSFV